MDKVTNVNYKIQLIGSANCQIVHANRLKLCYGHPEPGLQQISRNERNAGHSRSNQPDNASGHLILEEDEKEAPVHGEEEAMIQDDVIREDGEAPVHGEEEAMIQDDVIREDEEAPVHGEEETSQEGAPRNENEKR